MASESSVALHAVPDDELLGRLLELVSQSHRVEADLVAHIGEADERRLYARQAFPSMFAYCTRSLHLSEAEAYRRITVARAARQHPELLAALRDGRVHLSGLALLAPLVTGDNCASLLEKATHRSKRQVEELVAEIAPRPDAPSAIRKLPQRREVPGASVLLSERALLSERLALAERAEREGRPKPRGASSNPGELEGAEPRVAESCASNPGELEGAEPRVAESCASNPGELEGAEPPRLKESRERAVSLVGLDALSLTDDEGVPVSSLRCDDEGVPASSPRWDDEGLPEEPAGPELFPGRVGVTATAPRSPGVRAAAAAQPPSSVRSVEPLSPARYRVQFTASAELKDKLERLQSLMRHEVPDGDLAAIIDLAVSENLARLEARRFAKTATTRKTLSGSDTSAKSRHIPAAVRRAVAERAGHRCGFVDAQGRRCDEKHRLEFHHRHPFGMGGDHSPDNVGLLCPAHNRYLAERDYGVAAITRRVRKGPRAPSSP